MCNGGGLVSESCLTLATPWIIACQAPLSMGFLILVFICISLMTNDVEQLYIFFCEMSIQIFGPFLVGCLLKNYLIIKFLCRA